MRSCRPCGGASNPHCSGSCFTLTILNAKKSVAVRKIPEFPSLSGAADALASPPKQLSRPKADNRVEGGASSRERNIGRDQ